MLETLFVQLGPWNWVVLGLVLLILEIFVPGVFLLWIGIAALVVGALSLLLWSAALWSWEVQVVLFLVLSLGSALAGKKIVGRRGGRSDQPLLNRRGAQLIGRTATLVEPIVNGRGRVKIGDTTWRVTGPDLPAGKTVRVTGTSDLDLDLIVERA